MCIIASQAKYLGPIEPGENMSLPRLYLSKKNWSEDVITGATIPNVCAGMKIPKNVHGCGLKLSYRWV